MSPHKPSSIVTHVPLSPTHTRLNDTLKDELQRALAISPLHLSKVLQSQPVNESLFSVEFILKGGGVGHFSTTALAGMIGDEWRGARDAAGQCGGEEDVKDRERETKRETKREKRLIEESRVGAVNRKTGLMTELTACPLRSAGPINKHVTVINIVWWVMSTLTPTVPSTPFPKYAAGMGISPAAAWRLHAP